MVKARELLERVIAASPDVGARLLAPVVRGGRVCVRVEGLTRRFRVRPRGFEGWGVFRVEDARWARLERPASLSQVERYLTRLPALRWLLVQPWRGRSWWACPANASDARQRLGRGAPTEGALTPLHLVCEAEVSAFEAVRARFDGARWWFESLDEGADPRVAEALREALLRGQPPTEVVARGLTPGWREAYARAFEVTVEGRRERARAVTRARLSEALRVGGGALLEFESREEGRAWVRWRGRRGEEQVSEVALEDLTVLSAGICLSGEDERFDLQSLVGVLEEAVW